MSTIQLGMKNLFLPVAIEETTISILTKGISSEMKEKGLHRVPFQGFGRPQIAMVKKLPLIFFL